MPPPATSAASEAREASPGVWVQDCDPPPGCPDDGLTPDRCVADPAPFSVTFLDGEAVAISVDRAAVDALGLGDGTWWTAWSDGVSCERVVATFEGTDPAVTP